MCVGNLHAQFCMDEPTSYYFSRKAICLMNIDNFPKVWFATPERMLSTTKVIVFDDQGTMEIFLDGGAVFKGKKNTIWIKGDTVRGLSIVRQKINLQILMILGATCTIFFYVTGVSFLSIIFLFLLFIGLGLSVGTYTNWVTIEWEEQGVMKHANFANSSSYGWAGVFTKGTHKIYDALDTKTVKIEKKTIFNKLPKIRLWKILLVSFVVYLAVINLDRDYRIKRFRDGYSMFPLINPVYGHIYKTKLFILTFKLPFIEPIPFFTLKTPMLRGQVVKVINDLNASRIVTVPNSNNKFEIVKGEIWRDGRHQGRVPSELISRIVALAGDKVQIKKEELWINDKPISKFFIPTEKARSMLSEYEIKEFQDMFSRYDLRGSPVGGEIYHFKFNFEEFGDKQSLVTWYLNQYSPNPLPGDYGPITVPSGHVFILGDNRDFEIDKVRKQHRL